MPGGIRTPDLLVRSQSLYPAELQAHSQQYYFITFYVKCQDKYLISSKCTKYNAVNKTEIKNPAKIGLRLDKKVYMCYNYTCFETLAQSVEHTPFKRRVEGSNPSCLTKKMEQFRSVTEKARCFGLFLLSKSSGFQGGAVDPNP